MFLIFAPLINLIYFIEDKYKNKFIRAFVFLLLIVNLFFYKDGFFDRPIIFLKYIVSFDIFAKEAYIFITMLVFHLIFKNQLHLNISSKKTFLSSLCLVAVSLFQFSFLTSGILLYMTWAMHYFFSTDKNDGFEKVINIMFLFGVLLLNSNFALINENRHFVILGTITWLLLLYNSRTQINRRLDLSDLVIMFMYAAFLKKVNMIYPLNEYIKTLFFLGPLVMLILDKKCIEMMAINIFFMSWSFDLLAMTQAIFFIFGYFLLINAAAERRSNSLRVFQLTRLKMIYFIVPLFAFFSFCHFEDLLAKILLTLFTAIYVLKHLDQANKKALLKKPVHRMSFYGGVLQIALAFLARLTEVL